MPDFAISTIFKGRDKLSPAFSQMERSAKRFGKTTDRAFQRAGNSAIRFGDITKGILAANIVQKSMSDITTGVSEATSQFISFDDAITGATARFKDIGPDAANFTSQLAVLKARAREAGATTEFTATQAAQALDFLARAGFSSTEAMAGLNSMIDLATASGEDFAMVADFSSDLLGAFGLDVDNTAKKIANLTRLNDVLVKTANSANVTIESMFETMKVGGPIATEYGASLEDVAALTAVMGNAGIKGSMGATALKNIFTRLSAPTSEVTKGLESLGLTQADLIDKTGKMKNIAVVMSLIGNNLGKVAQSKKLGILKELFGSFAIAGGAKLVKSVERIDEFRKMLDGAAGTSQKTADIMRKSLGNRFKALGSAAIELGFKFFEAFEKRGVDVISNLTTAVRDFNMTPIINAVQGTIKVVIKIIKVIKSFLNILSPLKDTIPVIVAGMIAYNVALKAQIAIGIISFYASMVTGMSAAAGAQSLLNAAMAANPIGAVILGLTALIAVIVLVYKNWDTLIDFIKFSTKTAMNFWFGVWDSIKTKFLEIISIFPKTWEEAFSLMINISTKFLGSLQTFFSVAFQGLKRIFFSFVSIFTETFGGMIKLIVKTAGKFGKFFNFDTSGFNIVLSKIKNIQDAVKKGATAKINIKQNIPDIGPETKVLSMVEFGSQPNIPDIQVLRPEIPEMSGQINIPESPIIEMNDILIPDVNSPGISTPEIQYPPINTPEMPNFNMNEIHMPNISAPEIAIDKFDNLNINAPKINDVEIKRPDDEIVPPNRTELELKQSVNINGKFQFGGLPQGTTVESKTKGAPPIRTELLGE